MRELKLEQSKHSIHPRAMLGKLMDSRFGGASMPGKANARFRNDLSQELWCDGARTPHVSLQRGEALLPRRLQRHRWTERKLNRR
jgi:hypothetical protein